MGSNLDQEFLQAESGRESTDPVDFDFLAAQTFEDSDLQRELLELFVSQAQRVLPTLPDLPPAAQADAAHLLKGSARAIGARHAAAAAAAYELAPADERCIVYARLIQAFTDARAAIEARLA